MKLKIKAVILAAVAGLAVLSAVGAFRSMHRGDDALPEEILARFHIGSDEGMFCLRPYNGYVAVFSDSRSSRPDTVTDIELSSLRAADASLVSRGITVADSGELLELLEDLGS